MENIRERSCREGICDYLAELSTDYILKQINEKPQGLIIEMTFFFGMHLDEVLRAEAQELRRRRVRDFIKLCKHFKSTDPELDANLFLGTLQRLEYEGLVSPEEYDRDTIYRQFHRQLAWLLGLTGY